VLRMLPLDNCADTLVGNTQVRGVSGGEKKRVSIAEALVSNARLLCLDEISTGLDASVTFDILACLQAWTRDMRGTLAVSLQQPTPEVYALFDDVLLLREGHSVYHGPRDGLPGYLSTLGFDPPVAEEGGADIADWLLELLNSPSAVLMKQGTPGRALGIRSAACVTASGDPTPRNTAALAAAWAKSGFAFAGASELSGGDTEMAAASVAAPPILLTSRFAKLQYGMASPRPVLPTFLALVRRQGLLSLRNLAVLLTRINVSIVSSIILGLVWYNLSTAQYAAKLGMFVFSLAQMSFSNFPEISWAVEYKMTGFKQIRAGMYPAWCYTLAATIASLPVASLESAIFSLILYYMTHMERDGARWAFFYLIVFSANLAVGSLFRMLSYLLPTPEAAAAAPGPFIAIQLIFAGFLIAPTAMGTGMWLAFIFYSSVFAYGARSLAHNEFYAPSYQIYPTAVSPLDSVITAHVAAVPGGRLILQPGASIGAFYFPASTCTDPVYAPLLRCGSEPLGVTYLRALNIHLDPGWKWGGFGFLIFFALSMNLLAARIVRKTAAQKSMLNTGSTYIPDELEASELSTVVALPLEAGKTLPFSSVTVAWRELVYTVTTPAGPKTLLQGVSGLAQPGHMMALMGASGAGKTTLMDVLACRKTAGTIHGDIFLNGFPREARSFARTTAYCEQMDVHNALSTVRESMVFSAALRLPASVDAARREAFIEENLNLLEMQPLASRLVGDVGAADGLSQSQRKLLTIAVELVSNAPILFLDEPTSGLDARAAAMVIRVVGKIAATGRTIITTIHQPSSEIFLAFHDVLLLQKGGWPAYAGPLGQGGANLVEFLSAIPGAHALPENMNPASWMLDVLAGTDSSAAGWQASVSRSGVHLPLSVKAADAPAEAVRHPTEGVVLKERLLQSPHWAATMQGPLADACVPAPEATPFVYNTVFARSFPSQLQILLGRTLRTYSRSIAYVFTRIKTLTVLNMLFACCWYNSQRSVDCAPAKLADKYSCNNTPGGMQQVISIIFINALFSGVISISAFLPFAFRQRPVLYRERAAYMYSPEAHAGAYTLAEMLWCLFTVIWVITPLYFMARCWLAWRRALLTPSQVGFSARASAYFFYIFVIWLTVMCFVSLGQVFVAVFPNGASAQAVLSLLLPMMALFGGVYLPKTQLPNGPANGHPHVYWLWFYYLDPVGHATEALGPAAFADYRRPSSVNHTIRLKTGLTHIDVDALTYFERTHSSRYVDRYHQVAMLIAMAVGLQACQFYAVRFKTHQSR